MQFTDRLTIDRSHRTSDGYLRVHAKAARSGIQDYLGREVDPEGKHFAADQIVKVYRPPEEVFDKASIASFIGKPVTDDHPTEAVTAKNWRDHSRGVIGGAAKDGEWLGFDLALMDGETITKVDGGKCELSGGYACDLAIEDGKTPAGDAYQAVQRNIRGNHVAIVDRARAGSEARIADGGNDLFQTCDAATVILADGLTESPKMPHTLIIDGLQVPNVSDEAKAAIEKLQGQVTAANDARAKAETDLTAARKDVDTKDGEIVVLKKQVEDANDPTKQAARDAARAKVIAGAQALKPGITVDGKTDAAIRKEAVEAHLGDAAAELSDDAIIGAFAAATKDVKPAISGADVIRMPLSGGRDTAAIRDAARSHRYAN